MNSMTQMEMVQTKDLMKTLRGFVDKGEGGKCICSYIIKYMIIYFYFTSLSLVFVLFFCFISSQCVVSQQGCFLGFFFCFINSPISPSPSGNTVYLTPNDLPSCDVDTYVARCGGGGGIVYATQKTVCTELEIIQYLA